MIQSARLRISAPTEPIPLGRGFYQLEEDTLYVQIGPFAPQRRFFSYLEADSLSLQFDRIARLIFIEVSRPRRSWEVDRSLTRPSRAEIADLRWLDFRETIREPLITTDLSRTLLRLRFSPTSPSRSFHLADHILLQVDDRNRLSAIWIDEIEDDLAGREIAGFRKLCRRLQTRAEA
jgi:hypothetical protein